MRGHAQIASRNRAAFGDGVNGEVHSLRVLQVAVWPALAAALTPAAAIVPAHWPRDGAGVPLVFTAGQVMLAYGGAFTNQQVHDLIEAYEGVPGGLGGRARLKGLLCGED